MGKEVLKVLPLEDLLDMEQDTRIQGDYRQIVFETTLEKIDARDPNDWMLYDDRTRGQIKSMCARAATQ